MILNLPVTYKEYLGVYHLIDREGNPIMSTQEPKISFDLVVKALNEQGYLDKRELEKKALDEIARLKSLECEQLAEDVKQLREAMRLKELEREALAKDAIEWFDVCDKEPPYETPLLIKLNGVVQSETWQFDASDYGEFFYFNSDHLDDDIKEEFTITNKHIEGEILWARLPSN